MRNPEARHPGRRLRGMLLALGVGAGILSLVARALAADTPVIKAADPASISLELLPADPSRDLVIHTCVVCHPVELVVSKKRPIEEWDLLIARMVDHGAKADDDQQLAILGYFARHLQDAAATNP